jgi:hypothetical protein
MFGLSAPLAGATASRQNVALKSTVQQISFLMVYFP